MNIKKLIHDDDAVSPVIGVILMVAITVILAAVIASFVLGLGDSAEDVQPNSTFDFSVDDSSTAEVTGTLTDGDTVEASNIVLRGENLGTVFANINSGDTLGDNSGDIANADTWEVGQSVSWALSSGTDAEGTLRLVWEQSGSDNSATIAELELDIDTPP